MIITQIRLVWNDHVRRFYEQFDEAEKRLGQAVLKDSAPYVPKRTGRLEQSGETVPGGVQWSAPYAAALYQGTRNLKLSKAARPMACPRWFEAAKAQNKTIWVRNAGKIAGGKSK